MKRVKKIEVKVTEDPEDKKTKEKEKLCLANYVIIFLPSEAFW